MAEIRPNHVYRLLNKINLQVADVNTNDPNNVWLYGWHGGNNQRFIFLDSGAGDYYIISQHNGLNLSFDTHPDRDTNVVVAPHVRNASNHRWIVSDGEDVTISSRHNGKRLAADPFRRTPGGGLAPKNVNIPSAWDRSNVVVWSPQNQRWMEWVVEKIDTLRWPRLRAPTGRIDDVNRVPRYRDFNTYMPEATDPVLIGETLLPFLYINDPLKSRAQQAAETPYYRIVREHKWQREPLLEWDGHTSTQITKNYKVGLKEVESQEVKRVLNTEVSAKGEFKYSSYSVGIAGKMSEALNVTESTESTVTTSYEHQESITYPNYRYALAIYFPVDVYTLFRTDQGGTEVFSFTVKRPGIIREAFPDK